MTLELFSVA